MRLSMILWATKKRLLWKNRVDKVRLLATVKQTLIQIMKLMKSTRHKKGEKIANSNDEKSWGYQSYSRWILTIWNFIGYQIASSKMDLLAVKNNFSSKLKQTRQMKKTWRSNRQKFYSLDKGKMRWIFEKVHSKERGKPSMMSLCSKWAHLSIDSKLIRTKKIFKNWSRGYPISIRIKQIGQIQLSSKWWNRWWIPFRRSNSLRWTTPISTWRRDSTMNTRWVCQVVPYKCWTKESISWIRQTKS